MTTRFLPLVNSSFIPDSSGDIFPSPLDVLLTMANAKDDIGFSWAFPTGSDIVASFDFRIPSDFVGTPVLLIEYVIDGTPAAILAFGMQQVAVDVSETVDVAYETEDLANNSDWTGFADEDLNEETITITPSVAYTSGQKVFATVFRDDSVDTSTFDIILTGLWFQYSDI